MKKAIAIMGYFIRNVIVAAVAVTVIVVSANVLSVLVIRISKYLFRDRWYEDGVPVVVMAPLALISCLMFAVGSYHQNKK